MDDNKQPDPVDPLAGLPAASTGTVGGGWQPGSFGASGRGPRLLSGGGRRATAISTVSTLVVLGALVAAFLLAPGSAQVRHTFFDPSDMWQSFIGNPKAGYYSVGAAIWLNIRDRKSTRLNSSHLVISYAVFCLKKKNQKLKAELLERRLIYR